MLYNIDIPIVHQWCPHVDTPCSHLKLGALYIFSVSYILLHFNYLTTPSTITNKCILINETHFTIKIISNHFFNKCVEF